MKDFKGLFDIPDDISFLKDKLPDMSFLKDKLLDTSFLKDILLDTSFLKGILSDTSFFDDTFFIDNSKKEDDNLHFSSSYEEQYSENIIEHSYDTKVKKELLMKLIDE